MIEKHNKLKIDNIFSGIQNKDNKNIVIWIGIFIIGLLIYTLTRHTMDFWPFWNIARQVIFQGMDLYNTNKDFSYPPFFFCVVSFFSIFQFPVAAALWYIFNVSLLVICILLTASIVKYDDKEIKEPIKLKYLYLIPPALLILIIMDNLWLGQSNILVLTSICAALYFYYNKKTQWLTGLFIAMGIAIKVTPGLFLIYFLYKRDFKVLYGAILGLLLFFLVIPSFYYGVERNIELLKTWANYVLLPFLGGSDMNRGTLTYKHINQSIEGFLMRLLTDYPREIYHGIYDHININMNPKTVKVIANIWRIIIMIIIAFLSKNSLKKNAKLLKYEFALVIMAILFISPGAWNNHYIIILFSYIAVVYYIITRKKGDANRTLLRNSLAIAVILTYTGLTIYLQSFSGMFIGNFILWTALAFMLYKEEKSAVLRSSGRDKIK